MFIRFLKLGKLSLHKIPKFNLIAWGENLVERHSFHTKRLDEIIVFTLCSILGQEVSLFQYFVRQETKFFLEKCINSFWRFYKKISQNKMVPCSMFIKNYILCARLRARTGTYSNARAWRESYRKWLSGIFSVGLSILHKTT